MYLPAKYNTVVIIVIKGVWVVGNVGREKGGIGWPLFAAYVSSPLYIFYNFGFSIVTLSSMYNFYNSTVISKNNNIFITLFLSLGY